VDVAYELNRIFVGNNAGHGEFVINSQKGSKITGQAKTIKGPVNEDIWRKHLDGTLGIGIVPICNDSTCTWGAIDVDQYDGLDLEELSVKILSPLVLCRSKSGGMHVYLFTNVPVAATVMRKKLALVARSLGQPNAEIFPKQDKMKDGDIGNWINMPYFSGDKSTRYCIKNGLALSVEEFVNLVSESSINSQQLVAYHPEDLYEEETDVEFKDAPPCIRTLVKKGFPPGSRNSALFSMGVFARMKFSSGWEDKVFDYNQRFMGPGTYSEVAGIIRSLNKKSYVYRCKDQPLLSECCKDLCYESTYGIKPHNDEEKSRRPNILDQVERPVKCFAPTTDSKDDPYWVFEINGSTIDVTVDMARSQTVFAREYLRQYHQVVLPIKDSKWVKEINELLSTAEIHQLAPDAGPEGQMWVHLEEFCTGKSKARVREEMLLGKPWHEDDRTYFRSSDFMKYLDQQRFRALKDNEIFRTLKTRKVKHHHMNLKGKHVTCWSIESFSVQNEGFEKVVVEDEWY
jgi:hypothetical protein